MKLKTKLLITFLILILAPIMFTSLAFFGISRYQMNAVKKLYGVENASYETLSNTPAMLSRITKDAYTGMQAKAESDPDAFEDTAYLDSVNLDLEARYSFLVVRKGTDYIYVGTEDETDRQELLDNLPDYRTHDSDQDVGTYIGGNLQALVKQLDFSFGDGTRGTAFIVTSIGSMIPEVESMVTDSVLVLVMILIFTSLILTAWIYKSIVTPIHHLQVATKKITDGNLDFEMPAGGDDEIGELCTDFEEMRRRLKESAEEKLESERQNKELISNISHDLKTPITAVKGYVEGIMDGVADTPLMCISIDLCPVPDFFPFSAAFLNVRQYPFLLFFLHADEQSHILLIGIETGRLELRGTNPVLNQPGRQLRVILILHNYHHQFHVFFLLTAGTALFSL